MMSTKRTYSPPKIRCFGPVAKLTQAGSGVMVEGAGMMGMGGGQMNQMRRT